MSKYWESSSEITLKSLSLEEKLGQVKDLLQEVFEQGRLTEDEVSVITDALEVQSSVADVLKQENFQLNDQLLEVQPLKEKVAKFKQEATNTIFTLNDRVSQLQLQVLDFDKKLIQIGVNVTKSDSAKVGELDSVNKTWKKKMINLNTQSKKIIEEIVSKQCEARKKYEKLIYQLKEEVSCKEAEVAWCKLMMKNQGLNMENEMKHLKNELESTTLKNQKLLEYRLAEVERRASKMTRKFIKMKNDYEEKISVLKKEQHIDKY